MASIQAIATKRVNAVRTIDKATAALASNLNIEVTPLPNVAKYDAGYGQAVQLDHLAKLLRQIAIATKSAKESDFEIAEAAPPKAEVAEETEKESAAPKRKKK
jgi:hypothetical protein